MKIWRSTRGEGGGQFFNSQISLNDHKKATDFPSTISENIPLTLKGPRFPESDMTGGQNQGREGARQFSVSALMEL